MQGYLLTCFGLVVVDFLQTEQSVLFWIHRDDSKGFLVGGGGTLGLVLLLVNVLLVQN